MKSTYGWSIYDECIHLLLFPGVTLRDLTRWFHVMWPDIYTFICFLLFIMFLQLSRRRSAPIKTHPADVMVMSSTQPELLLTLSHRIKVSQDTRDTEDALLQARLPGFVPVLPRFCPGSVLALSRKDNYILLHQTDPWFPALSCIQLFPGSVSSNPLKFSSSLVLQRAGRLCVFCGVEGVSDLDLYGASAFCWAKRLVCVKQREF